MSETSQQYCTFHINGLFYGISVLEVQEVILEQRTTHVPLARDVLKGLINLRGQIVTALDLRCMLNPENLKLSAEVHNVVVFSEDGAISLIVDQIGDVLELDEARFENPPANLAPEVTKVISNVCKLQDELILILDIPAIVNHPSILSQS